MLRAAGRLHGVPGGNCPVAAEMLQQGAAVVNCSSLIPSRSAGSINLMSASTALRRRIVIAIVVRFIRCTSQDHPLQRFYTRYGLHPRFLWRRLKIQFRKIEENRKMNFPAGTFGPSGGPNVPAGKFIFRFCIISVPFL